MTERSGKCLVLATTTPHKFRVPRARICDYCDIMALDALSVVEAALRAVVLAGADGLTLSTLFSRLPSVSADRTVQDFV